MALLGGPFCKRLGGGDDPDLVVAEIGAYGEEHLCELKQLGLTLNKCIHT